ncbi:pro-sigmaK processing inhibitor BofA family protein [Helcococcus kunzii]|uniref:pro-sigmaK processing inhibitor BofA family protein n=1 Tax=Helcococcus kunzii TaxID=40091 RepID=UPI0021A621A1|nr:pro-sigmaK processing inhibitor BofA family protein [Helcococcus kunzii]MCT1795627.1 pro-sigmaK processing inhibitor BofA family protein [Helcococcus kunzii]MCT1988807.1 pro-sigmaK processing inhibitor BofA family protein [Helcococcus kunzii]
MENIIFGIIAVFLVVLVLKILKVSVVVIWKFFWNGVIGLVLLFLVNTLGQGIGLNIEMNVINSLIAGVFGIPGIILLLLV